MGIRAIPLDQWRRFLEAQGLSIIRTKGGHEMWNSDELNLLRPVTVQAHIDLVPRMIIHTSLQLLGITNKEFEILIENKKIPHVNTIRAQDEKPLFFAVTYQDEQQVKRCASICAANKTLARNNFYMEHDYKFPIISIDQQESD